MSQTYYRAGNSKTTTGLRPGAGDKEYFSGDILPTGDRLYNIGDPNLRWNSIYSYDGIISNNLNVGELLQTKNLNVFQNMNVAGTMQIGDITDTVISDFDDAAVITNRSFVTPRIHSTSYIVSPLISTMGFTQVDKFYASRSTDTTSKVDSDAAVKVDGGVAIAKRAWADAFQADTETVTPIVRSVSGTTSFPGNVSVTGKIPKIN